MSIQFHAEDEPVGSRVERLRHVIADSVGVPPTPDPDGLVGGAGLPSVVLSVFWDQPDNEIVNDLIDSGAGGSSNTAPASRSPSGS